MNNEKKVQLEKLHEKRNEIDGWITHMSLEDRASKEQDKIARNLNQELANINERIKKLSDGGDI